MVQNQAMLGYGRPDTFFAKEIVRHEYIYSDARSGPLLALPCVLEKTGDVKCMRSRGGNKKAEYFIFLS